MRMNARVNIHGAPEVSILRDSSASVEWVELTIGSLTVVVFEPESFLDALVEAVDANRVEA